MREAERGLVLLTCALGEAVQPLSRKEYHQVMNLLKNVSAEGQDGEICTESFCTIGLSRSLAERAVKLLDRPHQPRCYLQTQPEITVLTRISPEFPQRLRKLGTECPAVLFCKGDLSLLQEPCISVVGSRLLGKQGEAFARYVGEKAAGEGYVLVSGNAPGADRVAQDACLQAGGRVISFVPDALADCPLTQRQLFLSDEGYEFPFSAERALRRNHFIHALGEKAFVAQCPKTSGGTWSGTADNLKRGLSPVFVLSDGSVGIKALVSLGAVEVELQFSSITALRPSQLSIFD